MEQSKLVNSVLETLRYFSLFSHPLSLNELYKYSKVKSNKNQILEVCKFLVLKEEIQEGEGYYWVGDSTSVAGRKEKEGYAKEWLKKGYKSANIIYKFPFVRMVAISGSLSKGVANKKDDVDFFIITKKNRLWTCRSLLHLYKKWMFVIGKQHHYCMNYFIGESNLELEEKSYFTALELKTMIPLKGIPEFLQLINANSWSRDFLPNYELQPLEKFPKLEKRGHFLEQFLESDKLNAFFMRWTDFKWRRKWERRGFNMDMYDVAFKTRLNISKNHPRTRPVEAE